MICMSKDTSLLAEVFQNFRSMYLKIYKLDPANKFSAFGIAWQAALKKTAVKLDLLTDIDMLLKVEEGIRASHVKHVTLFIDMQNLIRNTWKILIKIKNHHIFNIGMRIICIHWQSHKGFL